MQSKPFSIKKKPQYSEEEKELLGLNRKPSQPKIKKNEFEQFDQDNNIQSSKANPMNSTKPNFKLRKPATGGNQDQGQSQNQQEFSNNSQMMRKPQPKNISKEEEDLLGNQKFSKPFKPNLRTRKNPSIHKDEQNQNQNVNNNFNNPSQVQQSTDFQDSQQSYQFNIQSNQNPSQKILSNKTIEKKPMLLKKNKEKRPFIPPPKEPEVSQSNDLSGQNMNFSNQNNNNMPINNRIQKQPIKQMDQEEEMKLRATTSKPFGPGAKKTPFMMNKKINAQEEIEKATQEVFGGKVQLNQQTQGKNLFQKKQINTNPNRQSNNLKQQQEQLMQQQQAPIIQNNGRGGRISQQQLQEQQQQQQQYEQQEQQQEDEPKQIGFQPQEIQQPVIQTKAPISRPNFGSKKKVDRQIDDQQRMQNQQRQQVMQQQANEITGDQQFDNDQQNQHQQVIVQQQYKDQQQQKQQIYGDNYEYQEQDDREINIDQYEQKHVSNSKIAKQEKRVEDLKQILQLEVEVFDDIFELKPTTDYDIYINKIKMGTLKNSADECKPESQPIEIQTEDVILNDFGNQAPDDENRTYFTKNQDESLQNLNQAKNLLEFLGNVYPVLEEILSQNQPDEKEEIQKLFQGKTYQLLIPEQIRQKLKIEKIQCVHQSQYNIKNQFIAYLIKDEQTPWFKITLIIEYLNFEAIRFYVTSSEVNRIQFVKSILITGNKDGSVNFWDSREMDTQHKKVSNNYIAHLDQLINNGQINELVFRFSSYSSEFLNAENMDFDTNIDSYMDSKHNSQIVDIIQNQQNTVDTEIYTLEEFGKIIQWNILELSKEEIQRSYIEYGNYSKIKVISPQTIDLNQIVIQHGNLITTKFQMDSLQNIYACSSAGILKINKQGNNKTQQPKQYHELFTSTEYPTSINVCNNSEIFITGYSDGSIRFYSRIFAEPLFTITNVSKKAITQIVIPEIGNGLEGDALKTIIDINNFYAIDQASIIYKFNIVNNKSGPTEKIEQQHRVQDGVFYQTQVFQQNNGLTQFIKDPNLNISVQFYNYQKDQKEDYEQVKEYKIMLENDLVNYYQNLSNQIEF